MSQIACKKHLKASFAVLGSFYRLKMLATDNGSPPKQTSASVTIHVSEFVNSAPTYTGPGTFTVEETKAIGTLVGQFPASDADSDNLTYSITGMSYIPVANVPPVQPVFWINPYTGQFYIGAQNELIISSYA